MATSSRSLIADSFYLSNVTSRELEEITGYDITVGLELLNEILSFQTSDSRLIPYYKSYTFPSIPTQEQYFIPDLIYPETLTFVIGSVRYSMYKQTRDIYWGSARVNNAYSLPYQYYFDRTLDGSNLWMYMPPQDAYVFTIYGKFSLSPVTLDENLETTFDKFYLQYLRYELASYICDSYQRTVPPFIAQRLEKYRDSIYDTSPIDLTLTKRSILQSNSDYNLDLYVQANIGRGFIPP